MEPRIIVTCALLILGLASRESGMATAMNKQVESRVMPAIQNTTKCYSRHFSQQLCSGHTTIEITDAVYGVSPCNASSTHCCPKPGDCIIPVEKKAPYDHTDYYKEILRKCNNRKKCDNLQAQWINYISQWCTAVPDNTDYVRLYYMCLTEAERRTTTATATTDDGDDEAGDNSTQTIVIIAMVVAVVAAVVVAVTVWMVCRKRQANNTSQAPEMMTSHASASVDDVDPYHTARPGGGPGAQGLPPARGLNDVTEPATNLYDTGQPLTTPMVTKEPKPNPKIVDKPNIGADLYTEVVKVRPRKNVVLDKSPGEEDLEANNNGSDMTEAGDRASYDLVMQENHGYGTRQGVGGEGEGEDHSLPHAGRQDGDQDEQTGPDYDLFMTENNAYS